TDILICIKSLYIDRSVSINDYNLNVESLIENLKNMIMKKLSILYITESSIFLSTLSVSFSTAFSQSSTFISVSDSPASAVSISVISTLTTSALTAAFITSSSYFKKILHRLSELYFSRITLSFNSIKIIKKIIMNFTVYKVMIFTDIKKLFIIIKFNITEIFTLINFFRMIDLYQSILSYLLFNFIMQMKDICVFRNRNTDIILFYTYRYKTYISYLKYYYENELFIYCILLSAFLCVSLSLSEKSHAC
ncbi:hypothetical protein BDFG_09300, partial [Blastomyces dermatitidis ATCC 26199]